MKRVTLLITCVAGLAVGFLLGRGERSERAERLQNSPAIDPPSAEGGPALMDGPVAPAAADSRFVRVFSALHEPMALKSRHELFEALGGLTAEDLPSLIDHAEKLTHKDRDRILPALIGRWFEVDLDAARAWAQTHAQIGRDGSTMKARARANPEIALRDALATNDFYVATILASEAVRVLAGENPADQVALFKTLPTSLQRDAAFGNVLGEWAKTDPAAAFAALADVAPGFYYDSARKSVLIAWAEKDPAGALAQVHSILPTLKAGVLGNRLLATLGKQIGENDPRLLLDWLGTIPVEFRSAAAIPAAGAWAVKEPIAALEWCMANGVDVARGNEEFFNVYERRPGVLAQAFTSHPAETAAWLEALPAGPDRDRLLERGLAEGLLRSSKGTLFDDEGGIALRLFNELPADGQLSTAADLGKERAENGDLTDLNAWAENFAPGPARAEAIAGAVGAAYRRDASQVEALLAGAHFGSDRDAALRGLAGVMRYSAPADAAHHALEIGNLALRRETLEPIISSWLKSDPDASRAWLRDAPSIPPDWKAAWMQ